MCRRPPYVGEKGRGYYGALARGSTKGPPGSSEEASGCDYAWLYPPSTGSASSLCPSYDGLFLHVGTGF